MRRGFLSCPNKLPRYPEEPQSSCKHNHHQVEPESTFDSFTHMYHILLSTDPLLLRSCGLRTPNPRLDHIGPSLHEHAFQIR